MVTPNPHVSEISSEKKSRIKELLKASKQWPAKDGMKLQSGHTGLDKELQVGDELMKVSDLLLEAEEHLLSGKCHPQLAKEQLQKSKETLKRIESQHTAVWDEAPRIRGRIYGDGDGSAYESKIYKQTGIDSVPDGIDELITMCEDISNGIYK